MLDEMSWFINSSEETFSSIFYYIHSRRKHFYSKMMATTFLANLSISISSESWFIPSDVFMLFCNTLSIIFAIFFLLCIIADKTCHTVPMMLVANTCLSALLVGCCLFSYSAFTLHNDIKQIVYEDLFCVARTYIKYSVYSSFNYSFGLQSLYRYLIVVKPTHLLFQSFKFQGLLVFITWLITLIFPLPFLLLGSITYDGNNQICMVPFRLSFSLIYLTLGMYMIPVSMTMFIYFKLIRYVHGMNKRITTANMISRAQRELKMVRRTVILVTILLTLGLIMIVFVCMSFFIPPPKYYFRFGFICSDLSLSLVMIVLYHFTDPLKISIQKRIDARKNRVITITR